MGKEICLRIVDSGVKKSILEFNDKVAGFGMESENYRMKGDGSEDLSMRKNFLLCAGFSDKQIEKISKYQKTLYPIRSLYGDIVNFLSIGIDDYQKIMSENPRAIDRGINFAQNKFCGIEGIGFSKEQTRKIIVSYPGILNHDIDYLKDKVTVFEAMGIKIRESIIKNPRVWTYDIETVENKLKVLSFWGFKDPKTVLKNDMSLGLENMESKIIPIETMCINCNLNTTPIELIEGLTSILSSKKEKIEILCLIVRGMCPSDGKISHIFHDMVFSNIENLLVAYCQRKENDRLPDLIKFSKKIKNMDLKVEDKVEVIKNYFNNQENDTKLNKMIYEKYKNGYLIKN
jgi:hypothetical protein